MRGRVWTGFLCAVVGGYALGCSERPSPSPGDAEQELAVLEERARGLREGLAGGSRTELQAEFQGLVADVEEWRARTGRSEIRVTTDSTRGPETGTAAPRDDGGGGDDSCASCPGYTVEPDRICFLEEEGACPDPDDEVFAGRICVYQCLWIGSRSEPGREAGARE